MAYDAAAIIAALEPPTITVPRGGLLWKLFALHRLFPGRRKTYVGRILSERQFVPFRDRFIAANEGKLDEREIERLWYDYLKAIGIPPRVVFQLPPVAMQEALESFFTCQLRASGGARSRRAKSTSTSDSRLADGDGRKGRTTSPDTFPPEPSSPSSSGTTEPGRTSDRGARPPTG